MIVLRIKNCKKITCGVKGDVLPHIVKLYPELFAIPLEKKFCDAYTTRTWPHPWKLETVTLVPKKTTPEKLADCRNLSCTAFFSKVLEYFVLTRMKSEI